MSDSPEKKLDSRIAAGDMAAYGEFFELRKDRIMKFILVRVGKIEEAEDILGDTFLKGLQYVGKYQDKGYSFASLMYRIANNKVVDFHRKNNNRKVFNMGDYVYFLDPKSYVERVEDRDMLIRVLEKVELSPRQKQVFWLHIVEGFSVKEAAEILEIQEGSVKVHAYNIRSRFRKALE